MLKGTTHKRGPVESRGRPRKLTPKTLQKLSSSRKKLIKQAGGEAEVSYKHIMRDARVSNVAAKTVSEHMRAHVGVRLRAPRDEPVRTKEELKERIRIGKVWSRLPENYFSEKMDGIMDNKKFVVPAYARALTAHKKSRVHGDELNRSHMGPSGSSGRRGKASASPCIGLLVFSKVRP